MKQFSKLMLIALSFGILTLALSLVLSKPVGAAGSAPVMVTNTPLPIQGTVNTAQSGPWNVGISGTPSVNISNSGSSPVLQRNVDAETLPHVGQKASSLVGLFTSSTVFDSEGYRRVLPDGSGISNFTIPAGRALVVTDVHWSCAQPAAGTNGERSINWKFCLAGFWRDLPGNRLWVLGESIEEVCARSWRTNSEVHKQRTIEEGE